ncbi:MAG: glycoside hydrolase family 5 protein [Hyphomicrobiales bacterium]|nr:glycoside hydrolase family 5 protein [Hyphomicrobiales bacterium]
MKIFGFRFAARVLALSPLLLAPALAAERAPPAAGVNFSGAEFGKPSGVVDHDYHYPSDADFEWAKRSGFVVIRLPFLWERLQPKADGEFDAAELERLTGAVARARAKGLATILDPHNYARRDGAIVGSDELPASALADLWRRLAARFKTEKDVVFGLMNEPHDMPVAQWGRAAQAAIDAIRSTGACNLVLVPGANWTGAHSWNAEIGGQSNAHAMAAIRDRGAHAFEFHQYLDADWSGEHAECRKPEEVVAALAVATDWLRAHRQKGFLGEFGAGPDAQCRAGVDAMLKHMRDNGDVWRGWTWWAAGAWWPPSYPLQIQSPPGAPAKPQMETLAHWIGKTPAPRGCR